MKRYAGFALVGAGVWVAYRFVTVTRPLYPNSAWNAFVSAADPLRPGLAVGAAAGLLAAWFTK